MALFSLRGGTKSQQALAQGSTVNDWEQVLRTKSRNDPHCSISGQVCYRVPKSTDQSCAKSGEHPKCVAATIPKLPLTMKPSPFKPEERIFNGWWHSCRKSRSTSSSPWTFASDFYEAKGGWWTPFYWLGLEFRKELVSPGLSSSERMDLGHIWLWNLQKPRSYWPSVPLSACAAQKWNRFLTYLFSQIIVCTESLSMPISFDINCRISCLSLAIKRRTLLIKTGALLVNWQPELISSSDLAFLSWNRLSY